MMRPAVFAVLLSATVPIAALAQTSEELKNDHKTPGDVLVYVCSDCAHRLDVVVDENDLIDDD